MNNPRSSTPGRTSPRSPSFRGTRELKFNPEEIQAIQAAERAMGYVPQHPHPPAPPPSIVPGVARLVGISVLAIFTVTITFALLTTLARIGRVVFPQSSNAQITIPMSEAQVPYRTPRSNSGPTAKRSENIHQRPSLTPTHREPPIGPRAEDMSQTRMQAQDAPRMETTPQAENRLDPEVLAHDPTAASLGLTDATEAPGTTPAVQQEEKTQFEDYAEMRQMLAERGWLSEIDRRIEGRSWILTEAQAPTFLLERPRLKSRDLMSILPRRRYYIIDTGLRCSQKAVHFSWKLAIVPPPIPLFPSLNRKGFVCTPALQGQGKEQLRRHLQKFGLRVVIKDKEASAPPKLGERR